MYEEPQTLELVGNDALASIERAQIDTQIATARRYPRNVTHVKQAMMSVATLDEETAAACFYTLPRGGKTIQGPSVRMAEIALSCYGNVKAGTRILSVHPGENPHAVVQAVVHDLERNVAYSVEKRRRITGKKSKGGKPDEDDINLAVNAGSAIAFRDAVFKVVPGALVKSVYEAAKRVAVGDVRSLVAQREKVVGRLKQMGVTEGRIFAAVGVAKLDEITTEHLETLIGLGTSIRDGQATIEEAFPAATKTAESGEAARPIFAKPAANPDDDQLPGAEVPAPTPEPTGPTPQETLAEVVLGAGFTWDQFAKWALASGYIKEGVDGFGDLPDSVAKSMLRGKKGLVQSLAAATATDGGAE